MCADPLLWGEPWKYDLIHRVLSPDDWDKLVLYYYDNESNTLFTHAGLSRAVTVGWDDWKSGLIEANKEALAALRANESHWLFRAGTARGGFQRCGGITWCDWNEFEPILGLNQVFGHTPGREPRNDNSGGCFNVCLDTHFQHYALVQSGEVTIHTHTVKL